MPRPILKWVGGKTQLLGELRTRMPPKFGRYYEPFVGGAAVFFDLHAEGRVAKAELSDVNDELVNLYVSVRDDVDAVVGELSKHVYDRDHYYAVRKWRPESLSLAARAARTIFLNKTGYNGLYRVNRSGEFNVPFGRFSNPKICDEENLRACSRALSGVKIETAPFSRVLSRAKKGDFVYFDPPYDPLSPTSDFTAYAAARFGEDQQRELANVFAELARRGVYVMLSNSDTPFVRSLYEEFSIDVVYASRSVNANPSRRGHVPEVIVRSFGGESAAKNEPRARRRTS